MEKFIQWLHDEARAMFALTALALTAVIMAIAMGAPPIPAIALATVMFIVLASFAPDVGLMLFTWIVAEAKKAASNATPSYATHFGTINTFTNAGFDDEIVSTGGGRFGAPLAGGSINTPANDTTLHDNDGGGTGGGTGGIFKRHDLIQV